MKNACRPTVAHIDLKAIAHNIQAIKRKVAPARIMAVVKADGYGHGAVPAARTALENGAGFLGVALVEEGIALRQSGIEAPILAFGGFFEEQIDAILEYDLRATIFDAGRARALARAACKRNKPAVVHVKVDTGMARLGVDWQSACSFVTEMNQTKGLRLEGVFTHFATSDVAGSRFAGTQLQRFNAFLDELKEMKTPPLLRHAANSGAILNLPGSYFDLVRSGVSLFGYYPSAETDRGVELHPALSLRSKVMALRDLRAGDVVSYGSTYRADKACRIANVPIGYADGFNRLLSNRGEVLIRGRRCQVVGRVCMDQIMVNVGVGTGVSVGDEVVLLGKQASQEISIYEICDKLNTIPYEVTCCLSKRIPRVYGDPKK